MSTFNGHKNWNHWNVSLWINNDNALYSTARMAIRTHKNREAAARYLLNYLAEIGITKTPDDAPYSVSAIRAAMRGL